MEKKAIVLVVILVIAIIALGAMWWWKSQDTAITTTTTETETESTPDIEITPSDKSSANTQSFERQDSSVHESTNTLPSPEGDR